MSFEYLVNNHGDYTRIRDVEMAPKSKGLKERFIFWFVKKFAPTLRLIKVGPELQVAASREEFEEFWTERVQEWGTPRVEDVSVFQCTVSEETGELI